MATQSFPELEREISDYWKQQQIFQRSIDERPVEKSFSFFDGPPFATGLPHYGHIVASTIKDVIPRYATMRGYRVERRWGWDCHGLPVENLIEKELGLKSKQDIEAIGVAKFNEACQACVLKYTAEWKQTIERLGRFVDMEHDYRTMDPEYMESVWWVFKQLYDQGLIYEGKKAMHVCPRCVTPLSNFEVTLGYKEIQDTAVTWRFKVVGEDNTYLLAWTTTPWSSPGITGLSIGPDYTYAKVQVGADFYYTSKDRVEVVFAGLDYSVVSTCPGSALVGLAFEPLWSSYKTLPEVAGNTQAYHVFAGDYVEVTEGTGIVTINGSYGDIDMQAAQRNGIPMVLDVDMDGRYNQKNPAYAGMSVAEAQPKLIAEMKAKAVFKEEVITHSYPHCWRCDTKLLNYATTSWFVRVTELKDRMIANNQQVAWMPDHVKQGRFGKWLEGAKDWAISRERYWGAPLPIWKTTDGEILCVGSRQELSELSGQSIADLHKQFVDQLVIEKDGKTYHRIGAVLDCWFESGAMPYAQNHWQGGQTAGELPPGFPADFIAEGLDQTRGWFYTLMVLSTALYNKPAFQNVIVNGLVLAEDGKKMSKRLKNYPEPGLVMDKYGADALRFYLMSSPVVKAEDLRFSEKGVDLVMKRVIMTLWNVQTFYQMFAVGETVPVEPSKEHVMDAWVLAYTADTVEQVTRAMERYDLQAATARLEQYIQEISTWYLRRSRDRFKSDPVTKLAALSTLRYVLVTASQLLAPFTPFIADKIYLTVTGEAGTSVHLQSWPGVVMAHQSVDYLQTMQQVRGLVEQSLALREQAGIKIRQPLPSLTIPTPLTEAFSKILADEVNVKAIQVGTGLQLDTTLTPELLEEGMLRELTRSINALRKQKKLTIQDKVDIIYQTDDAVIQAVLSKQAQQLCSNVLAKQVQASAVAQADVLKVNGATLTVSITV